MYKLLFSIKIISYIIFIFALFIKLSLSSDNTLKEANILFDKGEYLESVNLASENLSIESYIFRARTLAIYGHFLLDGEEALKVFKQAKELAFLALDIDRALLTAGDVFTTDQIDGYIDSKREEAHRVDHTPHPVAFDMYYSV